MLRRLYVGLAPLVGLAFLLGLLYGDVFVGGRTLLATGQGSATLPSGPYGYKGPRPGSAFMADPAGSSGVDLALDGYQRKSLYSGSFPFWNPYQGLGQTVLAEYLPAVLAPVGWLKYLLPARHWDLIYFAYLFLAGAFTYLFLRELGTERLGCYLGALAVLGAGWFTIYLPLREVPATGAFFPLLLFSIERLLLRPRWPWAHLTFGSAVYLTLTGGQPEVAFLSLLVASLYAAVRARRLGRGWWWKVSLLAGPACIGGLLLAAPQWLNFLELPGRALHVHGTNRGLQHLNTQSLIAFFSPFYFGLVHKTWASRSLWFWTSSPGYVSSVAIILAAATMFRRRLADNQKSAALFFQVLVVLTLAKVWGVEPINIMIGHLPGISRISMPRYSGFLAAFGVAFLAGMGLECFTKLTAREVRRLFRQYFLLLAILVVLSLWGQGWKSWARTVSQGPWMKALWLPISVVWLVFIPSVLRRLQRIYADKAINLTFVIAAILFVETTIFIPRGLSYGKAGVVLLLGLVAVSVLSLRRLDGRIAAGVALVSVVLVAGVSLAPGPGLPKRHDPFRKAPYISFLQERVQAGERVYGFDGVLKPNYASVFEISSLATLTPLLPVQTARFIKTYVDRGTMPLFLAANRSLREPGTDALLELGRNKSYYDLVGVRYFLSKKTDPRFIQVYTTRHKGNPNPQTLLRKQSFAFRPPVDSIGRIDVFFGTHGRTNRGLVHLRIFREKETEPLRTSTIDAEALVNRRWQPFEFDPIEGAKNRPLRIEIEHEGATSGNVVSIWKYHASEEKAILLRVYQRLGRVRLVYDKEVKIYENPAALPRLFLADRLETVENWRNALDALANHDQIQRVAVVEKGSPVEPFKASSTEDSRLPGRIEHLQISPNRVDVALEALTDGIAVLTDTYFPGWTVRVDGQERPLLRVNGVFRGVQVTAGRHHIIFEYRPTYWSLSLAMAAAGLAILLGITISSLLRHRQEAEPG